MNRDLVDTYAAWNADSILRRADELADVVIAAWPGPPSSSIDVFGLEVASLEDALLLLPAHAWTRLRDVVELTALSEAQIADALESVSSSVADRVEMGDGTGRQGVYFDAGMLAGLIADNPHDA